MKYLSLLLSPAGIDIRKPSVHIPLHILDISLVQNLADLFKNRIHNLFSGKIQHKLVPRTDRIPPRDPHRPVRMPLEQCAVLIDRLRLDPDPELHSKIIDPLDQALQRFSKLFLIGIPVSQAAVVIIPLAEPSVVQHQHLDSQLRGLSCKLIDRLSVKVKIGCLPAVHQDRTDRVPVFPAAEMRPEAPVQILRQPGQSVSAVCHRGLRHQKFRLRLQRIGKPLLIKSQLDPGLVELVELHFTLEPAAVQKGHGIAAPRVLCGLTVRQDHHRIVLMAGGSAPAADAHGAMGHGHPLEIPFHRMASVKTDQVKIPAHKVQTCRLYLFQIHLIFPAVHHSCAPGDHIVLRQHAVEQIDRHL